MTAAQQSAHGWTVHQPPRDDSPTIGDTKTCCPVPEHTRVDLHFRRGHQEMNERAGNWEWFHLDDADDIIAWRLAVRS